MELNFKWLHLSDIHFNFSQHETELLRTLFIEHIKENHHDVNALFITGDFRLGSIGKFEDRTIAFIYEILDALKLEIKDLFVVAGNHDIDRNPIRNSLVAGVVDSYDPSSGIISERYTSYLYDDRKKFGKFLKKLFINLPDRYKMLNNRKNPHCFVSTSYVNVLHIDTTVISCKESADEYGSLILGTKYFESIIRDYVPTNKPTIAIGHHPLSSLRADEYDFVYKILKTLNVHIYLCGHTHRAETTKEKQFDIEHELYQISSGNFYYGLSEPYIGFCVGSYDEVSNIMSNCSYYWDRFHKEWLQDNLNSKVVYFNSIIKSMKNLSFRFNKYIRNFYEYVGVPAAFNNAPIGFVVADLIFAEGNYQKKIVMIHSLSLAFDLFFDASVIYKTDLITMFMNNVDIELDLQLMQTLGLLFSCKKGFFLDDAYLEESAEFLFKIGFSREFCDICKNVFPKNPDETFKEAELLRLIDKFGDLLLKNSEREGFPVDKAIEMLSKDEKYNLYLNDFLYYLLDLGASEIV